MDAKAKPIEEILHSGHQFLVPFFQRNYSWKRDNWERLSNDIWSLIDERDRKKHFQAGDQFAIESQTFLEVHLASSWNLLSTQLNCTVRIFYYALAQILGR